MSKHTKSIGEILPDSIDTSKESSELSVVDKAKFMEMIQTKRRDFVMRGITRFESYEDAYDKLIVPVFQENDRKPPSLQDVLDSKLLLESWIKKSSEDKKQRRPAKGASHTESASEAAKPKIPLWELTDPQWEHIERLAHPLGGRLVFSAAFTPEILQVFIDKKIGSPHAFIIYIYAGLHCTKSTGVSSRFTVQSLSDVLGIDRICIRRALKVLLNAELILLEPNYPKHYNVEFTIRLPLVRLASIAEYQKKRIEEDTGMSIKDIWAEKSATPDAKIRVETETD